MATEKVIVLGSSGDKIEKEITVGDPGTAEQVWCGPVVELPALNTLYADVELPEMVFEYNQYGRLDSVFEAEI